jgi:hypothetical protein
MVVNQKGKLGIERILVVGNMVGIKDIGVNQVTN